MGSFFLLYLQDGYEVRIFLFLSLAGIAFVPLLKRWLIKTKNIISVYIYWFLAPFVVFYPIFKLTDYLVWTFFPNPRYDILEFLVGFFPILTGFVFYTVIGINHFTRKKNN